MVALTGLMHAMLNLFEKQTDTLRNAFLALTQEPASRQVSALTAQRPRQGDNATLKVHSPREQMVTKLKSFEKGPEGKPILKRNAYENQIAYLKEQMGGDNIEPEEIFQYLHQL